MDEKEKQFQILKRRAIIQDIFILIGIMITLLFAAFLIVTLYYWSYSATIQFKIKEVIALFILISLIPFLAIFFSYDDAFKISLPKTNIIFNNYINKNLITPAIKTQKFKNLKYDYNKSKDKFLSKILCSYDSYGMLSYNDQAINNIKIEGEYKNHNFCFKNVAMACFGNITLKMIRREITKGFYIAIDYETNLPKIVITSKNIGITLPRSKYVKSKTNNEYFDEKYDFYLENPQKITKEVGIELLYKIIKLEEKLENPILNQGPKGYRKIIIAIINNKIYIGVKTYRLLFKPYYLKKETYEEIKNRFTEESNIIKEILNIFIN